MLSRDYLFKLNLPNYNIIPDIIINNSYGYLKINNESVRFPKGYYIYLRLIPTSGVVVRLNGIEVRELVWVSIDNDFYIEANGECEILWQKVD